MAHLDGPAGTAGFMGRPRHRLFAIFDDPASGLAAVDDLRSRRHPSEDLLVLSGDEGVRWLDFNGRREGLPGRIIRLVEHAMSADVDYLRDLDQCLRAGGTVVVVPVADVHAADDTARLLASYSAHSFAYFANWGFLPVSAH